MNPGNASKLFWQKGHTIFGIFSNFVFCIIFVLMNPLSHQEKRNWFETIGAMLNHYIPEMCHNIVHSWNIGRSCNCHREKNVLAYKINSIPWNINWHHIDNDYARPLKLLDFYDPMFKEILTILHLVCIRLVMQTIVCIIVDKSRTVDRRCFKFIVMPPLEQQRKVFSFARKSLYI